MPHAFARSAAISLALCAMVLRAVLPDGWMPAAGAAPFVICSVEAGAQHDGKAPAQAPRSHAPCAFAAAAPLSPPASIALLAANRDSIRFAPSFAAQATLITPAFRPNAARAPPAFS